MPMVINLHRRGLIRGVVGLLGTAHAARIMASGMHGATRLVASWRDNEGEHHVGVLMSESGGTAPRLVVASALHVPTRAHGFCVEPAGTLLSVARRPGDWLLRWRHDGHAIQWRWAEADRVFNGHVLCSADGLRLYTTETRLDTGMGLIGVRDARSLEKINEWPTHGLDPHELVWLRTAARSDLPEALVVANGGVLTRAETGRQKGPLAGMDASLVTLHARTGELTGQWRLLDASLSLRHLAWQACALDTPPVLGIALQAEHQETQAKLAAPVLALWNGHTLQLAQQPQAMAGYGGDIDSVAGGFLVSSPKAGLLGRWDATGQWLGSVELPQACALATHGDTLWCAGQGHALLQQARALMSPAKPHTLPTQVQLDNHWQWLQG